MVCKRLFFIFFFIVFSILMSYSQILRRHQIDTTKGKAPFFELEDIDFKKIKQTDLIGKVVVINFWGPRCPPCLAEIPNLNTVVKNIKSENVVFIAICPLNQVRYTMDKYGEIREFLKTKEFLYRICPVDDFGLLSTKFNSNRAPTHFIIDKRGYIVYKHVGIISENNFIRRITKEIEK